MESDIDGIKLETKALHTWLCSLENQDNYLTYDVSKAKQTHADTNSLVHTDRHTSCMLVREEN